MGCKGSKAKGSKAADSDAATEALLQDPENKADDTAALTGASVEETATDTEPMLPDESAREPATQEAQSAVDHPKQAELAELEEPKEDEAVESKTEDAAQAEPLREAQAVEAKDVENAAPEVEAEAVVGESISKEVSVSGGISEVSTAECSAAQEDAINLALLEDGVRPIDEDTATPKEAIGGGGCFFCCGAKKVKEKEKEAETETEKKKEKETETEKEKETAKAKAKPKAKAKEKEKAKAKAKSKAKEKKIK